MLIKTKPSFLVIFWPVLAKKKKDITAITKKSRATKKGEKSAIFIGIIKETIPNIKVEVMATFPI